MIESSGAKVIFVRGHTAVDKDVHPFHANYTVNPDKIKLALNSAIADK